MTSNRPRGLHGNPSNPGCCIALYDQVQNLIRMPSFVLKNFVVRETLSPYQTWAWKAYLLRQLPLAASSYPSSPEEVISPKANLEKRETGCWIKSPLCFDDNASSLNYFSCNPLFYGGNKQTNMTRSISWETAIGLLCHSRKTKPVSYQFDFIPFAFLSSLEFSFFLPSWTMSPEIILSQKIFVSSFVF